MSFLLCKLGDLTSEPQTHVKAGWQCRSVTQHWGRVVAVNSSDSLATLAETVSSRFHERPGLKVKSNRGRHPTFPCAPPHTHPPPHAPSTLFFRADLSTCPHNSRFQTSTVNISSQGLFDPIDEPTQTPQLHPQPRIHMRLSPVQQTYNDLHPPF